MLNHLPKSAMVAVLTFALAFTSVAATPNQARAADAEDVIGVLAGLAALYAIGRAIQDNNDDHRADPIRPRPGAGNGGHRGPRVAPARCFREFDTRNGVRRGYGARCMQNNVRRPGLLPPECIRRVQTYRGTRNLYGGRCLVQNGWHREAGWRH